MNFFFFSFDLGLRNAMKEIYSISRKKENINFLVALTPFIARHFDFNFFYFVCLVVFLLSLLMLFLWLLYSSTIWWIEFRVLQVCKEWNFLAPFPKRNNEGWKREKRKNASNNNVCLWLNVKRLGWHQSQPNWWVKS